MRHKHCCPPSHQAAAKQLDLFGLPGAKYRTPEFEWQQLPEETRETVTKLMVRLLALGADVESAWYSASATPATRKRIIRTLIEEIVVRVEDDAVS